MLIPIASCAGLALLAGLAVSPAAAVPSGPSAPAAPAAQKAPAPPTPPESFVGKPLLRVVRAFGRPSAVRDVRLVPQDKAAPVQSATMWTYRRENGGTLEVLIAENGRVLRVQEVAAELERFRVEPR